MIMRSNEIPNPVQRERQLDYNRAIAQKIRNRLQQLENANEKDKRRWIWELLQNASDTVQDRKVDIKIIVAHEYIEFCHNGGYFSPRNITNLIHQISSKEGLEGNIGRFGTGFLTTHTLSRLVEVEGVFDEDEVFFDFKLILDRRKTTEKELVEQIEKSWDSFQSKKIEEPQNEVWTKFRYRDPDKKLALETLKDFETFVYFNLAFVDKLGKIIIENQVEGYKTFFELSEKPKEIEENIYLFSFLEDSKKSHLLLAKDKNLSIAIEVEKKEETFIFKPIASNVPRVFCAFPLIGTESFYFPFVINSQDFIPKTERDKLYLKGETKDAQNNKDILFNTLDLYKKIVHFASAQNWKDFFVIIPQQLPKEDEDLDEKWYRDVLQKPLLDFLTKIPIVENENGNLISILNENGQENTYFPSHVKQEVREKIWDFSMDLYKQNLPSKKSIHNWYQVLWTTCYRQTLEVLLKNNIQNQENIEQLSKTLDFTIDNTYLWLGDVLLFVEREKVALLEQYAVLPNQYGRFRIKNELYEDRAIPDELKEVYKRMATDWKEELLHPSIKIKMERYRTVPALSQTMNPVIRENKFDFTNQDFNQAIYQLISYAPQNIPAAHQKIWDFSKALFFEEMPLEIVVLENVDKFDWSDSLHWQIHKILQDVSTLKYLETLESNLHLENSMTTLEWLGELIEFLQSQEAYKALLDNDSLPILPNQNAFFYPKSQIYLDDGTIDEALKDVLRILKPESIDELLDKNIYLELPKSRERTFIEIAQVIDQNFRDYPAIERETREFKQAFETLFAWFQEQTEETKKNFDWINRNIAVLYISLLGENEDRNAVLNIATSGKAHIFSNIANNQEISEEDLTYFAENSTEFKKFKNAKEKNEAISSKQEVENELLQRLNKEFGKNSHNLDEFIATFGKQKIRQFMREPTTEDSQYFDREAVGKSNEEARRAIRHYLEKQKEYDVSNWTEHSKTMIQKVSKNDIAINIIAKGADNGIVYLTKAEIVVLKNEELFSELWVHTEGDILEINLGKILELWNTTVIKAHMFDFSK